MRLNSTSVGEDWQVNLAWNAPTGTGVEDVEAEWESNINRSKEILAFEATRITHGEEEAQRAYGASVEKFGESDPQAEVETSSSILRTNSSGSAHPCVEVSREMLREGFSIVDAFVHAGLCKSRGEARRLITQGGAYIGGDRVKDDAETLGPDRFEQGGIDLRAGKKRHMRLVLK